MQEENALRQKSSATGSAPARVESAGMDTKRWALERSESGAVEAGGQASLGSRTGQPSRRWDECTARAGWRGGTLC
jgi:hypothetical protein